MLAKLLLSILKPKVVFDLCFSM